MSKKHFIAGLACLAALAGCAQDSTTTTTAQTETQTQAQRQQEPMDLTAAGSPGSLVGADASDSQFAARDEFGTSESPAPGLSEAERFAQWSAFGETPASENLLTMGPAAPEESSSYAMQFETTDRYARWSDFGESPASDR